MSVGDITWKVNGIDLDTALGSVLTASTTVRPDATVRVTEVDIPGEHGVLSPGLPVYSRPQVILAPRWSATSQAQLEEYLNHAQTLFGQPNLVLSRVSGALETSAVAKLASMSARSFLVGRYESRLFTLTVPGVFFRAAAWTSDDMAFSSDLVNVELAGLSGSTAPIGDAVIRVTGPCTNPEFIDPMSGSGVVYTGTVPAGSFLFLSARPLSARVSSSASDWLSGGSDVSGAVSFPAAGRLQLWPVVQSATTRRVLLGGTGSGRSAATKVAVQGRGAFL